MNRFIRFCTYLGFKSWVDGLLFYVVMILGIAALIAAVMHTGGEAS